MNSGTCIHAVSCMNPYHVADWSEVALGVVVRTWMEVCGQPVLLDLGCEMRVWDESLSHRKLGLQKSPVS